MCFRNVAGKSWHTIVHRQFSSGARPRPTQGTREFYLGAARVISWSEHRSGS